GAMGGPVREAKESVDAIEEAIQVIRLMWSEERSVSFEGRHYRLDGLHPGPQPVHPIGIWLGAYGPRMVRLVGRLADGWLPSVPRLPLEEVPPRQQAIDEAARAAGRDPASIRRIANVGLEGSPDDWVDQLTVLARDYGFDGFILSPGENAVADIERFGSELAPAVRENLRT